MFAAVIGQTALADAYKLANETPNIVYDLLIGGVLAATLVPLFTQFLVDEDDEATNVVLTVAATLMAALTVVAVVAAPLIFRLYTLSPSDDVDPQLLREVGTSLTRIFLVQILFYGLTGLMNAYLNSRRRFFAAAWSPILPNLVIIVTLVSLPDPGDTGYTLGDVLVDDRLRWTLGLGATAGIASMALALIPAAVRAGLRFRPRFRWRHPAVSKLLRLSGWTFGFVAANQVALLVIRNLAQRDSGFVAAYFDAFTLFVLPHGLLAVSVATTFQPELARAVSTKDREAFVARISLGTRVIALLSVPAAVVMLVLRDPIVGVLFQRGQFDDVAAANTARALAGFAVGLVAFSIYLFVLRGFYAHQDTRTAFVLNVGQNALNVVLAFVLVGRFDLLGLTLAYSVSYLLAAAWALQVLSYKVTGLELRPLFGALARMGLAGVLMAEAVWVVAGDRGADTGAEAVGRLVVGGLVGATVYLGVLVSLGSPELAAARARLRRTRG